MQQTIRPENAQRSTHPTLYLAFELSNQEWKLGFTVGLGQHARQRKITAGDTAALTQEIALAKQRFGLPADAPVVSCYEAGRDGFWLHRFLENEHITNLVVDSASIEVSRRGKQVKTDRLDVEKLLSMLLRYHGGEARVWSVVHVPSLAAEDHRQLHRQLLALKEERTRYVNRIKGLLVGQGIHLAVDAEFLTRLPQLRLWDGSALPEACVLACNASSLAGSSCTARSWNWKPNGAVSCATRKRRVSSKYANCCDSRASATRSAAPGSTSWSSSAGATSRTGARSGRWPG